MAVHTFPTDLGDKDAPMIRFDARRMLTGSSVTDIKLGGSEGAVWLPIPAEGVSTTHPQNWGEKTQNIGQAAIGKFISDIKAGKSTGAPGDRPAGGTAMDATSSGLMQAGGAEGEMKGLLEGYTLNKLGVVNFDQRVAEQAVVSYTGPSFRQHSFAFSLRPIDHKESIIIDQIVKFFLMQSSPEMIGNNALLRLYKLPAVFEISFHIGSKVHPGITGLSASALTTFDVKHGGEKYNVFKTGYPVQTDISLSFKELKLMDRSTYAAM